MATCPEHGPIGAVANHTESSYAIAIMEARFHDDVAHGVARTITEYRRALAARILPEGRGE